MLSNLPRVELKRLKDREIEKYMPIKVTRKKKRAKNMAANVKATRMELQAKKRNHKMAVRGHKLLKEKRDGSYAALS